MRTFACAVIAVALLAAPGRADDAAPKKNKKGVNAGPITAVDAAKGTVTIEVRVKKNTEKKTFAVTSKTTVTVAETKKKSTRLTAAKVADLLKKEPFKVGANVSIEPAEGDAKTAKAITFAAARKKAAGTTGQLRDVDADKGTVTVEVKVKKAAEKKTFTVTDKTTVTVVEGKKLKTELTAQTVADLLKKEAFKVGAAVTVEPGEGGTAKAIIFNAKKKKKEKQ